MSLEQEIWATLSAVDVSKAMDKTGSGVGYVSWSKIWAMLMDKYPRSFYHFDEIHHTVVGEDGPEDNVEVWCSLTIMDEEGEEVTRQMWLPVMQSFGQFKDIANPSPREISDTRMRCLVKICAIFGLGLSAWSGDDYKEDPGLIRLLEFSKKKSDYRMGLWQTAIVIKESFEQDDGAVAAEAWRECDEAEQQDLWIAETKGGFFTTKEKEWLRAQTLEFHPANQDG